MPNNSAVMALRLLADESRMKLFLTLKTRAAYPGDLAKALKITPAAVSQHLRLFKSAGLVETTREGTRIRYGLRHEIMKRISSLFKRVCDCSCDCCSDK